MESFAGTCDREIGPSVKAHSGSWELGYEKIKMVLRFDPIRKKNGVGAAESDLVRRDCETSLIKGGSAAINQ